MENQNGNGATAQNGDVSGLNKMFSDYRKKQTTTNTTTRKNILEKYFVPRGIKETFRILPPKPGKKHIEEAFFHVVTTNASGGKKKHGTVVYCPAHNDPKVPKFDSNGKPMLDVNGNAIMTPAPCPLCAQYKKKIGQQDPSLRMIKKENMNDVQLKIKAANDEIYKEAIKWEAKKFYIIRGIDKGSEKSGVKFWRFKHNYKNQGTLDKLLPILEDFTTLNQVDFADANNGTDLSITTADSTFNNHVYKTISAISSRGKSPLHADSILMREWLNDPITWREVFQPKKAPVITPYEFLEMIVAGTNPYWDDTDAINKRWVFPGRPDLEAQANTRNSNLDKDDDADFEQASDLDEEYVTPVTISNITPINVGTYNDNAVDVGASVLNTNNSQADSSEANVESPDEGDYDDLPF